MNISHTISDLFSNFRKITLIQILRFFNTPSFKKKPQIPLLCKTAHSEVCFFFQTLTEANQHCGEVAGLIISQFLKVSILLSLGRKKNTTSLK
jgi:hypothetical protein